MAERNRAIAQQVTVRPEVSRGVHAFTLRRTATEFVTTATQVGVTALLPNWAVVAVDAASTLFSARTMSSARRRMAALDENPPDVGKGIGIEYDAANIVLREPEMLPLVNSWETQELDALSQRAEESKRRERAEVIHRRVSPALTGVLRASLLVLASVPHTGEGLVAVGSIFATIGSNPAVLLPAAIALATNPIALLLVGTAIVSSYFAARALVKLQEKLTKRLDETEPAIVRARANIARGKYSDSERSIAEIVVDGARSLIGAAFRWLRSRRSVGNPNQ